MTTPNALMLCFPISRFPQTLRARAQAAATRVALTLLLVLTAAPWALAGGCVRAQDRVLLVSTRTVGCSTNAERLDSGVAASEYAVTESGGRRWVRSDAPAALASLDPSTPTIVYVHGNQITASEARRRGVDVYCRLVRCGDGRPVQFVIFSWPSSKVPGLLRDFREKAARTRPVAGQLAWALARMPEGAPVGLLGYSYGARVSTGALHLASGGALGGLSAPAGPSARPTRVVLFAPALDCCWLGKGRYNGLALQSVDSLLTTVNRQDRAMRLYRFVSKTSDPTALGYAGPGCLDADYRSLVKVRNVTGSVGKSHDLYDYMATPGLMAQAWRRLAFVDPPAVAPSDQADADTPTLALR
ncbi:hypothetical protein Mal64_24670 [Pseudobythopirellula maris]|uniref:Alpha/beta hydrolase family protein n=1 Tax=Pseudobythopirellula maris TaxID=2527991 RepID=A0A5C5ZP88_9BACT|nr:alpha/beta hydrolase [Pseudobythopirellula maris]TWT88976.1 hypothetical protein Mal64_24670 [Pseudobythopirellula maris]